MFGKQFLGNKNTCMMRYCHIPTYYLFILVSSDIISTFTGVIVVVCFSSFVVTSIPLLHAVMINIYYTILSSFVFEFLLVCHVCCSVMCVVMITECHPIFNITFIITLKSREDGCSIQGLSFNHLSPYTRKNNKSYIMCFKHGALYWYPLLFIGPKHGNTVPGLVPENNRQLPYISKLSKFILPKNPVQAPPRSIPFL